MTHPVDPLIDYARPCMMAERALKALHDAALHKDYDAAVQHGIDTLVEVKMTIQNLRLMKEQEEQENALRKQTAPV